MQAPHALIAILLGVTSLGARTPSVTLSDGTTVSGTVEDLGQKLRISPPGGSAREVFKREVASIDGADPILELEFLVRDFEEAASSQDAERVWKRIEARQDLDLGVLWTAAHRPPQRSPQPTGESEHRIEIAGTSFESSYVLYVPASYDPATREWPLWISMHGTGDNGKWPCESMQPFAEKHGFLVAAPTERTDLQGAGWGYTDGERSLTLSVVEDVKRQFAVDPNRIYLGGWSRGGHAAYDIAMHYPALFAGSNPVIGAPRAKLFGMLRNLGNMAFYVVNGAKDQDLLVAAARAGTTLLKKPVGADVVYYEDPNKGHEPMEEKLGEAVDFLLQHERHPDAEKLEVATYDPKYGEGLWLRIDAIDEEAYHLDAPIKVPGLRRGMGELQQLEVFQRAIFEGTAHLDGVRKINAVTLRGEGVARATIFVSGNAFDLDKPIRVQWKAKKLFNDRLERNARYLLDGLRARHDRGRLFWNEISVDLGK